MTTKRTAKKVTATISLAQFEAALANYASNDAASLKLAAEMDVKINDIRKKYDPQFEKLVQDMEQDREILQAYCEQNKATLFIKSRTMFTVWGKLGFRTGNPKLKTLRGITWEIALQNVKKVLPKYVRKVEEVAKDLLLADRNTEKVAGKLREAGLQVVQDETFFIEMKQEEPKAKRK